MKTPPKATAIARATARDWSDWAALLGEAGGGTLSHPELAELARRNMPESVMNPGWWAQSVAVAYEQAIGRRVVGQDSNGTFRTSVSQTVALPPTESLSSWGRIAADPELRLTDELGASMGWSGEARTTTTEKWWRWRRELSDGSRVAVDITRRTDGRTLVTLTHSKLSGAGSIPHWKGHWKPLLHRIGRD